MHQFSKQRALALALVLPFAGCSAPGSSALPSSGAGSGANAVPAEISAFLYVLNEGNSGSSSSSSSSNGSLAEFHAGRPHLLNDISDGINAPRGMAFDGNGNVYVANGGGSSSSSSSGSNGSVSVYVAHGSEQVRTITRGINEPDAVAVDSNGTVYVANLGGSGSSSSSSSSSGGSVTVYRHGHNRVAYVITAGISSPRALAMDNDNNLYVLNGAAASSSSGSNNGSVAVFALHHRSPSMVLTSGIDSPTALAVDGAGDVFVANAGTSTNGTTTGSGSNASGGSVVEFSAGSRTPTATITNGIAMPRALALDGTGSLFVANEAGGSSSSSSSSANGTVAVYPSGTTTPSRVINDGITAPDALAVASNGMLFVANAPSSSSSSSSSSAGSNGNVQVYQAGHSSPRFTITNAIAMPIALGVN
ncbi:MAG: hypothetical protein JO029_13980 [Candidatus Eremiobacteraeota bacterium]|nr:hypothetical protein [Candidatus Eremiobacteraeota bacterium]